MDGGICGLDVAGQLFGYLDGFSVEDRRNGWNIFPNVSVELYQKSCGGILSVMMNTMEMNKYHKN